MHKKIIFTISNSLRWILIQLICIYQKCISPFLGNHCRFYPSCSQYAKEAIQTYPIWKSFYLISHRLLRCNSLCRGGVDLLETPAPTHTPTIR